MLWRLADVGDLWKYIARYDTACIISYWSIMYPHDIITKTHYLNLSN